MSLKPFINRIGGQNGFEVRLHTIDAMLDRPREPTASRVMKSKVYKRVGKMRLQRTSGAKGVL
eukprot:11114458-Karenia_brevis.AAC.1